LKSLVKKKREPGIWLEDVAVPEIGPNDLLIRIRKTSICGTDIHIYNWDDWSQRTVPVPMTTGHEFSGVVAEVGSHVAGYEVGDRVSGEGHITCGYCRNCRAGRRHLCRNTLGVGVNRPGCFAEYLSLPATNAFRLPDSVPDEVASFLDPFGNATHCALSFDLVGEDVLITGAGPIGCMAAAVCRHIGARYVVVTDVNQYRLDLAKRLGATCVVNVQTDSLTETMEELGMTEGFDVALEMSGAPSAFDDILKTINHGGRVAILGIPPDETTINWNHVIFKGLTLKGIYGREMYETWYKMSSMLQSGLDIRPILTHQFPIDGFQEAFELMRTGQTGKVVLDWEA
jgi:threonine 3-dehydrogenase